MLNVFLLLPFVLAYFGQNNISQVRIHPRWNPVTTHSKAGVYIVSLCQDSVVLNIVENRVLVNLSVFCQNGITHCNLESIKEPLLNVQTAFVGIRAEFCKLCPAKLQKRESGLDGQKCLRNTMHVGILQDLRSHVFKKMFDFYKSKILKCIWLSSTLCLSLFLCLSVFLSIFVMKFPRWDTKFEKWKCWVRLFILAFIGHRPCVWKWARLTKRRQIRHSAPSWKASRGDAMQMILQSCFVLFFNCGKTGDKATERKRREVRNMSGKASLVRKSHVSIHSCNVRY